MYKNLCTDGLGITVRQNELIELALTYGYKGIEIDMADMAGRAESMGHQFATQFINSASVEVGTFELPIDFSADDQAFNAQEQRLELICQLAKEIDAHRCYINVAYSHDTLPYHENFEQHRTRISAAADRLAEAEVICGLKFSVGQPNQDAMQFIHKPDDVLALMKSIDRNNVGLVLDTWTWQIAQATMDQVKALDLNKVTEVRLADPAPGFEQAADEIIQRMQPGSHPNSLCQATLDWLKSNEFEKPVALTAIVPKSHGNSGENPFQRIDKVFERMLLGEQVAIENVETPDVAAEEASEPITTATE